MAPIRIFAGRHEAWPYFISARACLTMATYWAAVSVIHFMSPRARASLLTRAPPTPEPPQFALQ